MNRILFIALGGAVGALLRFWLSALPGRWFGGQFPLGTLLVNVLGALAIGVLFALAEREQLPLHLQPLLITGFLGALTTFSTFSLENLILVENGRPLLAALYIVVSVALGLLAVFAGAGLVRALVRV